MDEDDLIDIQSDASQKVRYCLGFVFDSALCSVVLTKKEKGPHTGKWNGLGGKIEDGENPYQAMSREYGEEANGCEVDAWDYLCKLQGDQWEVFVFSAVDPDCGNTMTAEQILKQDAGGTVQVLLDEGIESLPLAPYARTLLAACLEHRVSGLPHFTISE